ncbi:MAG TPA: chemotaxis protein CheW [Bryobacteraceae bacterium]|nr:chemotaxis protein CheW [Bryobacteraceae bacterium]
MNGLDDDIVRDYLAECREHLAGIENDLLAIEQRGADIDKDLVNKVFRAAHSIKGGAGFFDLNHIRELAHKIENVLDLIRSQQAEPTSEVVNVLLLAFDRLRELIENPGASEQTDISEFVSMLESLVGARLPQRRKNSLRRKITVSTPTRKTRLSVTAFDFDTARKTGSFVYLLEYDLIHDIQRKNKKLVEVVKELMRYGSILDNAFDLRSAGTLENSPSNCLPMDVLYSTALGPDLLGSVVELPPDRMWKTARNGSSVPLPASDPWTRPSDHAPAPGKPPEAISAAAAESAPEIEPDPAEASMEELEPVPPMPDPEEGSTLPPAERRIRKADRRAGDPDRRMTEPAADGSRPDATVRLNIALLDVLMNLAGELVLGRNQLNDAITQRDPAMIQAASQRISVVTSDVQDAVMRTRMQEVGNLFQKFPRLVRDMARKLDKDVRLVEEGSDVDLDKTIIEGLSDPLTHMVRNAIDHGIETPAERAAQGKPPGGTLSLRAWHEAGLVVVEVADDGRGLDAEQIAGAAVAKGLISAQAAAAMPEEEKLALVFLPGLSTAKRVSDLSGRGVGLDVVKTNLDRLGGTVEISSQPGKGASFRIKLPLTLAIIPSLLVSAGPDRVAIPLVNVQELVRVPAAEIARRIDRVGSASVLMLRDGVLPLARLDRVLDLPPRADAEPPAAMNVVVLSGGAFRYGLVVEQLHGTVEIVVKPLGRHLQHLREYGGATILGDGCVALILDVAGLAGVAGLTPQEGRARTRAAQAEVLPEETQHLLLFRNSAAETCAVPLHGVSRVVKIRPEEVERVGGRRTMQQRGCSLPLVLLSEIARVDETTLDENAIVVVMESGGREFGLLASRPVDVVEAAIDIDPHTLRQPGVMGSTVFRGRTTLVLEASELAQTAWPGWQQEGPESSARLRGARVLIVEDSTFFRERVVKIMEGEGATALTAGDGEAAWEILGQNAPGVSLVVTDIEMPRLDGLELTRRIRSTPRLAGLPVIMLTSLAGEEEMERGRAAGATAYCIKLDRDQLAGVAAKLLAGERVMEPGTAEQTGLKQLARHLRAEADLATTMATADIGEVK